MPFVGRLIDKEVQELPRPPAPALSPGYAPLIKHIQTVTLYCQDAADGLTSHFNHESASRPEAGVTKSAGVLGPVLLHSGKRLFRSGHAYFQLVFPHLCYLRQLKSNIWRQLQEFKAEFCQIHRGKRGRLSRTCYFFISSLLCIVIQMQVCL